MTKSDNCTPPRIFNLGRLIRPSKTIQLPCATVHLGNVSIKNTGCKTIGFGKKTIITCFWPNIRNAWKVTHVWCCIYQMKAFLLVYPAYPFSLELYICMETLVLWSVVCGLRWLPVRSGILCKKKYTLSFQFLYKTLLCNGSTSQFWNPCIRDNPVIDLQ